MSKKTVKLAVVGIGFVGATVWSWLYINMTFSGLFGGFSDLWRLVQRMLPPDYYQLSAIVSATIETLWMALIGTAIAVLLSIPLAFGAARNTTPHAMVFGACRGVITLTRAVPDLIFAAIFVQAFGIGPLAGVLALGLHSIGMIGKMFADAIENADADPATQHRQRVLQNGSQLLHPLFPKQLQP